MGVTVFVVLGGWDYEGYSDELPGVYDSREKAEACIETCKANGKYYFDDYVIVESVVA